MISFPKEQTSGVVGVSFTKTKPYSDKIFNIASEEASEYLMVGGGKESKDELFCHGFA